MHALPKILTIVGTRPEVIKMSSVIRLLDQSLGELHRVCTTGQQKDLLEQTCQQLGVRVDDRLAVMQTGQGLSQTIAHTILELQPILQSFDPDWVLVHGDTASCLGATLAAFYSRIKVAHVEAGLRSGQLLDPYPEESIRIIVDQLSTMCFAPSQMAWNNLYKAGIDLSKVVISGNTGIDALQQVLKHVDSYKPRLISGSLLNDLKKGSRLLVVTVHRFESRGRPLEIICQAIRSLVEQLPDARFLVMMHPHPSIGPFLRKYLASYEHVYLQSPLPYIEFVWAIKQSFLLLTDSGGVQEEAPYLGKPVILLRNTTERQEMVQSKNVCMTGTELTQIVYLVMRLWSDNELYNGMASKSTPYGIGGASEIIVNHLLSYKS